MRMDPTLNRNPDESCWVTFCLFPISSDGNIQFQEGLGQHHRQAVIGYQSVNHRDGIEPWYQQTTSLSHQLTGGSQPGGASSGVRL
jgi:hypothetical protein